MALSGSRSGPSHLVCLYSFSLLMPTCLMSIRQSINYMSATLICTSLSHCNKYSEFFLQIKGHFISMLAFISSIICVNVCNNEQTATCRKIHHTVSLIRYIMNLVKIFLLTYTGEYVFTVQYALNTHIIIVVYLLLLFSLVITASHT